MEHPGNKAERLAILKNLIRDLHAGADFAEVKARFGALIKSVGAGEIAALEQALVAEGMPPEEIKRLCDVHAALFADAIGGAGMEEATGGHPLDIYRRENEALRAAVSELRKLLAALGDDPQQGRYEALRPQLASLLEKLFQADRHYVRKENQLFPVMERRGITAPPKVMWAVHDDTRAVAKRVRAALERGDAASVVEDALELAGRVEDMVSREENILFPMVSQAFSAEDWEAVRRGDAEVGYALADPGAAAPAASEAAPMPLPQALGC